jgi:hypothetical protein
MGSLHETGAIDCDLCQGDSWSIYLCGWHIFMGICWQHPLVWILSQVPPNETSSPPPTLGQAMHPSRRGKTDIRHLFDDYQARCRPKCDDNHDAWPGKPQPYHCYQVCTPWPTAPSLRFSKASWMDELGTECLSPLMAWPLLFVQQDVWKVAHIYKFHPLVYVAQMSAILLSVQVGM